jgi:hypothetical protein
MLAPAARCRSRFDRAREQPDADAERGAVTLEREEVLLGERLVGAISAPRRPDSTARSSA